MADQNFRVKIGLDVGAGGTVVTTTPSGLVGIGSTIPSVNLDVIGNVRVSGASTFIGLVELDSSLKDLYGNVGAAGSVLISTGSGVSWSSPFAAGIQGIQGTQGSQGIQGTTGPQGTQGTTGIQGTTGTQGIQGIQGTTGTQGIQGIQGTTGTQGIQGIQGTTGTQGSQGIQGIQGTTGTQGIQGIAGPVAGTDGQVIYNNGGVAGGASNLIYDDTNNRVGIGTTNPQFLADVAGDIRVTQTNKMRFGGTSSTTNFYIQYNSTTNSLDFVAG